MRADDPVILRRLQEIEAACEGLRMACGFPPRVELPETAASRKPYWCPECALGFKSLDDVGHHLAHDHPATT